MVNRERGSGRKIQTEGTICNASEYCSGQNSSVSSGFAVIIPRTIS